MSTPITPWYTSPEALAQLASCAKAAPEAVMHTRRYPRTTDEWRSYNEHDDRVARLQRILNRYAARHLDDGNAVAAGLRITVNRAIDAVMPQPMCAQFSFELDEVAQIAGEIAAAMDRRIAA